LIVSEIGLNHLGDSDYADLYLENLINAKSEAVTFQIAEKSFYEKKSNEGLTLTNEYYSKASKLCHKNKIKFGIALSDEEMIDFFENINVDFYKTRSKDIANFSLLSKLGKTGKKLFLSTGLAGIPEIQKAIKKIDNFKETTILIHTQLSHDLNHVNLKSIPFLQKKIGLPVGYGHHAINSHVLYLALAFNPSDLFFYVKGKRVLNHPDEEHAFLLDELPELVKNLNQLTKCIGEYKKSKMDILIENME
tara:strand:- start:77 stop:823 length:747 start_codon:yes stop_codon:yes gene_type:complete